MSIRNYWVKFGVTADWAWHKDHGYLGGTDYGTPPGTLIVAASDGTVYATEDGLNSITEVIPGGHGIQVNYRELHHRVGHFPRQVKQGDVIGVAGRLGTKFLHMDADVFGTRVPFETVVTPTISIASTVVNLIRNPEEHPMYPIQSKETKNYFFYAPLEFIRPASHQEVIQHVAVTKQKVQQADSATIKALAKLVAANKAA